MPKDILIDVVGFGISSQNAWPMGAGNHIIIEPIKALQII